MRSFRHSTWLIIFILILLPGATLLFADILGGQGQGGQGEQTPIGVDIYGFGFGGIPMVRKDPLAVPLFMNLGPGADRLGLAKQCADQVGEDMRMTGRFDVIDRAMYVEDPHTAGVKPGTFDFKDWKLINAEYLIKGAFSITGEELTLQIRLYHVPTERMLLGKEYTGPLSDWYVMVHRFSNDVVYELTRQKGVFGAKVAYVSGTRNTLEVSVIDLDGRNQKRLTFKNGQSTTPSWSPDGKQIVFSWRSNDPADSNSYIYIINAEGGEPQEIFKVHGLALTPRFSPSGSRVALAISYNGNMELYTISARGGTPDRLTVSRAIEIFPAWSPNGDQMVFVSDRSGGPQIWRMRSDGSDVQRISWHGAYNQAPDWSPEGDKVVYSAREGGVFGIIMMNPDGSEPTLITQGQGFGSCEYPSFSPDGRSIVMSSDSGRGRTIRIFNVDASYTKLLTKPGTSDKNPAWSPRLLN